MNEDKIKEAFNKVRKDMDALNNQINNLRQETLKITEILHQIVGNEAKKESEHPLPSSTRNPQNQTPSTHTSTHKHPFKPLKHQNIGISTRNEGASTDRQTDRQTNRHTLISTGNPPDPTSTESNSQTLRVLPLEEKNSSNQTEDSLNSIDNAARILDSLDNVKKEIRKKFKRLTDQELLVFSTLYQIEEEDGHAEYSTISNRLNLSESSIRDYVSRLIKKGIPVEKTRVNNKFIHLNISKNLKKIATLPTILRLRDL